jgi:hypothetical protein
LHLKFCPAGTGPRILPAAERVRKNLCESDAQEQTASLRARRHRENTSKQSIAQALNAFCTVFCRAAGKSRVKAT